MANIILKAEHISKQYRLGLIGTGTLSDDLKRWWFKIRGKDDPFLKIGEANDRSSVANSDYVWALQDINFEVQQGEVLGIIGKNGAGKSTLLKLLSRVTTPTTGTIKANGKIASLLEVGTGFHPELTGKENIYLNGAILGMTKPEIKKKEAEIISFSGCERYIDTPVKRYSSGMRVRLAFAVAAFLEPDILVIDEVLAVGDAEFQKKAVGKMQDISKGEGRTVLFVSHNMAAVRSLCTRAIVLEHGKTVFEGNTNDAVDFYIKGSLENKNFSYKNKNPKKDSDLIEVAVLKGSKPTNLFAFNDVVSLSFKLKVSEKDIKAKLGFKLIDKLERIVFSSNIDLNDHISNEGEYIFKVNLPENLLAPNDYKVHVGFHVFKKYIISKLENVVSFSIEETGSPFQNHVNDDIGCVIVDCDWNLITD